jgi:uncharacterized protein involved in propanediol utilization
MQGAAPAVRVGVGTAGHHHGEILQGAVRRAGELILCLITMPAAGVGSTARYVRTSGPGWEVLPAWKQKAERAARLTLARIGERVAGRLEIECSVATGIGLGSSTCDVVAAIRAVCSAHGARLDPSQVADIAIEAEGAADPIMFENEIVLFAQRRGEVLESFGTWSPHYTVISVDTDLGSAGVDTLSLQPPEYSGAELAAFERMIDGSRQAFRAHDSAAIAAIATQSARLNQRFVPLRGFAEICAVASDFGALGVQISHSGTVAGILFDPWRVTPDGETAALAAAQFGALGLRTLAQFTAGSAPVPIG